MLTLATLSSFKKPDAPRRGLSEALDHRFTAAWSNALARQLALFRVGSFTIEATRVEMSSGAVFIHFSDPSGGFAKLRELVARARDEDPELAALPLHCC